MNGEFDKEKENKKPLWKIILEVTLYLCGSKYSGVDSFSTRWDIWFPTFGERSNNCYSIHH
jgi:hypothetical protein